MYQCYLLLFKRTQVIIDTTAQVLGAVKRYPAFIGLAGAAYFSTNNQIGRVWVQRFVYQAVGDVLAIIVGGIDKINTRFNGLL